MLWVPTAKKRVIGDKAFLYEKAHVSYRSTIWQKPTLYMKRNRLQIYTKDLWWLINISNEKNEFVRPIVHSR